MSIKILVVDDEPDFQRLIKHRFRKHLRQKEYEFIFASNGLDALDKLHEHSNIDIVLSDINMPEMNGYQVCQQIKADPQTEHIPVIFISALNETLDKVTAFKVGAADYISKPFEFEEVIARVENQVKIVSLQKKLQQLNLNLEEKVNQRTKQLQIANQDLKKVQQRSK